MDRTRAPSAPSAASPVPQQIKPERTRRKLQKNNPARRSAWGSLSSSSPDVARGTTPRASTQAPLRLPPDLSDAKWVEYLRTSGLMTDDAPTPPREMMTQMEEESRLDEAPDHPPATDGIPAIIPEFAHLTVQNAVSRPSLDSSTTSSPTSSTSTVSTMRRRAKTPVFSIGQLEEGTCGRSCVTADKVSSVDLIAAQYQALLDPRDIDLMLSDSRSEQQLAEPDCGEIRSSEWNQPGARDAQAEASAATSRSPQAWGVNIHQSPSSEGTLVAFDEEAIYFKPLSFSSEPPSPLPYCNPQEGSSWTTPDSASTAQDNLGLQICTDLLTRELATAMLRRPGDTTTDTSALQILVMIEAYERLRDQVTKIQHQQGGLGNMESMFDTWLGSLYSLHGRLSGEARLRGEMRAGNMPQEELD